ncbi:30S ribosomal protein S16 [Candidatus Curtissbacteria bacterium RIFCSPHIGHO2_01_FULL_41_44]|uniref:Small ribosomal subunit protein bS16 n=1 Tax=Candidatus Curtissbacteria bacterium RIFCSPLOWO2_01_FULL_42_50 TaxID=1797730 RepID=A0A1F5H7L8_9BACT|nr:MAG: 30S ribosomal protein S16 [Candidatus Curtissbacteria bacterium RIFCSPHIGHO2_01_FULL_41_44]OGD94255.1 MAG: 30S ribosomal protein S16 [Candidatus Curtissbacteria bacterium RIFCSPHIGHO2_02_FULL_42_58]OGD97729.1 MAG: 30S ribosomal protein S16 [Candidatus Curtissbacteria bacterium RIFCSPHIGHO2_12_FULL_42_33]OGE00121.1 MAG: 30S ribosomal protein S16 [Candidatus Curtissbacteria bacterium RIFCSPLOWO2_01_FULL_42_50]OGE02047.1 MAG: 30S ribosomal protein S16 [Candidatus Curtissbacteria bacterium 
MSVKIRLSKTGKKHQISFRIAAFDTKRKRDGKFLEILGYYYPHGKTPLLKISQERFNFWLSHGAKPTEAVTKLLNQTQNDKRLKQ